jgi:hypothetical protein
LLDHTSSGSRPRAAFTHDDRGHGLLARLGEVTIGQLLATWVVHDLNHLGQIFKTMAKQYSQAVGPWRELLPIIDAPSAAGRFCAPGASGSPDT